MCALILLAEAFHLFAAWGEKRACALVLACLLLPRQACAAFPCARWNKVPAGGAARLRSRRRAAPPADSAADAALVLRLLAPTRWLPAPLLAAAELLPALRRTDVAQARPRTSRLQPGCGRLGRALAARGLPAALVNRAPHHTCGGVASQGAGGVAAALAGAAWQRFPPRTPARTSRVATRPAAPSL